MSKAMVTAIDFGTSKIVALIADTDNSGPQRCDIIGTGIAPYDGYMEGSWNNPGELDDAIQAAISEAEEQSHRKVKEVNVGVPGAFCRTYATEVSVELKGTDPRVTPADVNRCFAEAQNSLGDQPGIIINSSPAWFMVDDGKKTLEPVTVKGRTLHAMISFIIAEQYFLDDIQNRMETLGYKVSGFYSTAVGEATLYLPETDRDRTAVLIDMGYLNTDVMVVEGDALLFHHCIEIGGGDIAAALAENLDISLRAAEHLKRSYTFGVSISNATCDVPSMDGEKPLSFEKETVAAIIEPIIDDLAAEITACIEEAGIKLSSWSNFYLTGGGIIFNHGGRDYLAGKLERPVRETPKRTTKLNSPAFASALGLLDLIIHTQEQTQKQNSGFIGFFKSLIGM